MYPLLMMIYILYNNQELFKLYKYKEKQLFRLLYIISRLLNDFNNKIAGFLRLGQHSERGSNHLHQDAYRVANQSKCPWFKSHWSQLPQPEQT